MIRQEAQAALMAHLRDRAWVLSGAAVSASIGVFWASAAWANASGRNLGEAIPWGLCAAGITLLTWGLCVLGRNKRGDAARVTRTMLPLHGSLVAALVCLVPWIPNRVFYAVAGFVVLAAWSIHRVSPHVHWIVRLREWAQTRTAAHACLAAVVATVAVCFGATSLFRFDSLRCWVYDLGIFDSLCWFALRGKLSWYFGGPYDHFSPILLTCLPFYWLWPTPKTLLVIQACVLAFGAVPLYLIGRALWRDRSCALALCLAYLLNPLLSRVALYDFHAVAFLPVLFFYACWAFLTRRTRWAWLLLVSCLCVKEGVAVLLLAFGVFLFGRRMYRAGLALIALAVAWSLGIARVYYPFVVGQEYPQYHQYAPILSGGMLGMPGRFLGELWKALGRHYTYGAAVLVLLPVGFLPLRSAWATVCLCGLPFLEQILNVSEHHRMLGAHYGMLPLVGAFATVAFAHQHRRPASAFLVACALGANLWFADSPFQRLADRAVAAYDLRLHGRLLSVSLDRSAYRLSRHERLIAEFRRLIPEQCSVTAQQNIGCFFTRRERFARLGTDENADFALFDERRYAGPVAVDSASFNRFRGNARYRLFFAQDGFRFFCEDAKWRAAAAVAENILRREPDNRALRCIAGAVYANAGLRTKARAHLERLLPIRDREYVDTYWLLGDGAFAQGDLKRTMAAFRAGLTLAPDDAKAHYALGLIYDRLGRRRDARDEFGTALRLDPSLLRAKRALQRLTERNDENTKR